MADGGIGGTKGRVADAFRDLKLSTGATGATSSSGVAGGGRASVGSPADAAVRAYESPGRAVQGKIAYVDGQQVDRSAPRGTYIDITV